MVLLFYHGEAGALPQIFIDKAADAAAFVWGKKPHKTVRVCK